MSESLLTSKQVARLLNVSASTLCRWRDAHEGPDWINLAGLIRYRAEDLDSYVAAKKVVVLR
jgi:predicted DNA-binding transcriptional regulator AlpA